jgi:hypothetical protein
MNIQKNCLLAVVGTVVAGVIAGCSGADPGTNASGSQSEAVTTNCVQKVLCIQGDVWDPVQCKCVPQVCISGEDGPCGGFTTHPCQCGPGLVCVPNSIPDIPGTCEPDRCCPIGWDMYTCKEENGASGHNCHNPRLACPLSLTCGGGCNFQVTSRCTM